MNENAMGVECFKSEGVSRGKDERWERDVDRGI